MILAAENTKQYNGYEDFNINQSQNSYGESAQIFVVNGDCLDTVQYFKTKYPTCNPAVLNMANAHCPGGGWRQGLHIFFSKF